MTLPGDFIEQMADLLGADGFTDFEQSMSEPCPVSIRLNRSAGGLDISQEEPCSRIFGTEECEEDGRVLWCEDGVYLRRRPSFTMDPLLHAGAYYVQEASSMFVAHIIRQFVKKPVTALDLCAAPGGKTTLLLSTLPDGSFIVANEVNHKRSNILAENVSKWLKSNKTPCVVTNNEARDFKRLGSGLFDLILCDVPCSGEGMFRKDVRAIEEWSKQSVDMCWRRQREIVSDIWNSLKEGGLMIYSTCTYNTKEDEENVRWIRDELGADVLDCNVRPEWNIMGSMLKDENFPCYHFMSHKVRGEGFFCAVLIKRWEDEQLIINNEQLTINNEQLTINSSRRRKDTNLMNEISKRLHVIPLQLVDTGLPRCELCYNDAIRYLQGEALRLSSDIPKGMVLMTYQSFPLGMAKNIGSRANNLYPKEWRIRNKA